MQNKLQRVQSSFTQRIPFLQKFADVHLIVGFLSSVILPIVGFVGSCILVRYKGDYTHCLIENHFVKEYPEFKPRMEPLYTGYKQLLAGNNATSDNLA